MHLLKKNIPVISVILVKDPDSGGYTSYFAQLPNIISEGDSETEAINNLFVLAKDVFQHQKSEALESARKYDHSNVIVRNLSLVTA